MGYISNLFKIFRGTVAGDKTGTPARTAAEGINDNMDSLNNALEEVNNNAEQKSNKTGSLSSPNNTTYPTTLAVAAANSSKLDKGTYVGTAENLLEEAKGYTDSSRQGSNWKNAVLCATTTNITLSGEQIIDGVQTAASRVLVKDQTNPIENGIYLSSATAWTRATDADEDGELIAATVNVLQGSVDQADKTFYCTSDTAIIGTDAIEFVLTRNATRHNETTGLQGGNPAGDEYFHLSAQEKTDVETLPQRVTDLENKPEVTGIQSKPRSFGGGSEINIKNRVSIYPARAKRMEFPGIALNQKTGRVLTVYRYASTHAYNEDAEGHAQHSDDFGKTWSAPVPFYDKAAGDDPAAGPAVFWDAKTDLWLITATLRTVADGTGDVLKIHSTSDGVNFSEYGEIPNPSGAGYLRMVSPLQRLKDGRLAGVVYVSAGIYFVHSSDNGQTWNSTLINATGDESQLIEDSGTIYCYSRNGDQLLVYTSTDKGVTWGAGTDITPPDYIEVKPTIIPFGSGDNIRLMLIYREGAADGTARKNSTYVTCEGFSHEWSEPVRLEGSDPLHTNYYSDYTFLDENLVLFLVSEGDISMDSLDVSVYSMLIANGNFLTNEGWNGKSIPTLGISEGVDIDFGNNLIHTAEVDAAGADEINITAVNFLNGGVYGISIFNAIDTVVKTDLPFKLLDGTQLSEFIVVKEGLVRCYGKGSELRCDVSMFSLDVPEPAPEPTEDVILDSAPYLLIDAERQTEADETMMATLTDFSGNDRHLTSGGSAMAKLVKTADDAYFDFATFNEVYSSLASFDFMHQSAHTILIEIELSGTNETTQVIMGNEGGSSANVGFALIRSSNQVRHTIQRGVSGNSTSSNISAIDYLPSGVNTSLLIKGDPANATAANRSIIDDGTTTVANNVLTNAPSAAAASFALQLGERGNGDGSLAGKVRRIVIWDRHLTTLEETNFGF